MTILAKEAHARADALSFEFEDQWSCRYRDYYVNQLVNGQMPLEFDVWYSKQS